MNHALSLSWIRVWPTLLALLAMLAGIGTQVAMPVGQGLVAAVICVHGKAETVWLPAQDDQVPMPHDCDDCPVCALCLPGDPVRSLDRAVPVVLACAAAPLRAARAITPRPYRWPLLRAPPPSDFQDGLATTATAGSGPGQRTVRT